MEKFTFQDSKGSKKKVEVEIKEKIGAGAYGDIFLAHVNIKRKKLTKERQFSLKRFKPVTLADGEFHSPRKSAKHSVEAHDALQNLSISTWTTYRLASNKKDVLLSLAGNREKQYIIDISKNSTHEDTRLYEDGIEEIVNLEEVIQKNIQALIEADIAIELMWDSFFQIYDGEKKCLYPIVGDFENVYIDDEDDDSVKLTNTRSLMNFLRNIREFLSEFVSNEINKEKYLNYVDEQMKKITEDFRNSNDRHKNAHI